MLCAARSTVQLLITPSRSHLLNQRTICSLSRLISFTISSVTSARSLPPSSTLLSRVRLTMSSTTPLSTSTAPATSSDSTTTTAAPATTTAASAKAKRSIYNDTALHVLKGAIVNILGPSAAVTASVAFSTPYKATLSIVWAGDVLSLDTITAIETEANRLIQLDLPVQSFSMARKAAEQHYTANPVNHTYIYDRFPVPDTVDPLTLTLIDHVNINCCSGQHTATTAALRRLRVLKAKKGKVKEKDGSSVGVVEFLFLVHEGAEESFSKSEEEAGKSLKVKPATTTATATAAAGSVVSSEVEVGEGGLQSAVKGSSNGGSDSGASVSTETMPAFGKWRAGQPSHVREETDALLELLRRRMASGGGSSSGVLDGLDVELERRLVMFSNVCYTMGFTAAREVHTVDRAAML